MTLKKLRKELFKKEMKITTLHQCMAFRQRKLFLSWKELMKQKKAIKLLREKIEEKLLAQR